MIKLAAASRQLVAESPARRARAGRGLASSRLPGCKAPDRSLAPSRASASPARDRCATPTHGASDAGSRGRGRACACLHTSARTAFVSPLSSSARADRLGWGLVGRRPVHSLVRPPWANRTAHGRDGRLSHPFGRPFARSLFPDSALQPRRLCSPAERASTQSSSSTTSQDVRGRWMEPSRGRPFASRSGRGCVPLPLSLLPPARLWASRPWADALALPVQQMPVLLLAPSSRSMRPRSHERALTSPPSSRRPPRLRPRRLAPGPTARRGR